MTSSPGHAHLRTCGMKIQNAQIALKLDTDVAEILADCGTIRLFQVQASWHCSTHVFTCDSKLASYLKLARNGQIGQKWPDFWKLARIGQIGQNWPDFWKLARIRQTFKLPIAKQIAALIQYIVFVNPFFCFRKLILLFFSLYCLC